MGALLLSAVTFRLPAGSSDLTGSVTADSQSFVTITTAAGSGTNTPATLKIDGTATINVAIENDGQSECSSSAIATASISFQYCQTSRSARNAPLGRDRAGSDNCRIAHVL